VVGRTYLLVEPAAAAARATTGAAGLGRAATRPLRARVEAMIENCILLVCVCSRDFG